MSEREAEMSSWRNIQRQLERMEARFTVQRSDAPPSAEDIAKAEADLEVRLPAEFRRLLLRVDALYVMAKQEYWPLRKGGAASALMPGFTTFGIGKDVPASLKLATHVRQTRRALSKAGDTTPFVPVMQRFGDAGLYGFVSSALHYRSSVNGRIVRVEDRLLRLIDGFLKELEAGASVDRLAKSEATSGVPDYATPVLPLEGVGEFRFGQSHGEIVQRHGRAPLQRVYPKERRIHEVRDGLELIFFEREASPGDYRFELVRFVDGCTPVLDGRLMFSREGRAARQHWARESPSRGIVAFPELRMYDLRSKAFAAASPELDARVAVDVLIRSKPLLT